jgi:DNA-directed RNA polymerase subunit omega
LSETLKEMDHVDSKFRFVHVASRRARQLMGGARALTDTSSRKPTRVAQEEVLAGLVAYEIVATPPPRTVVVQED